MSSWFEELYRAAERGEAEVPWDRGGPYPPLLDWWERHRPRGDGRSAIVVGCGPGEDAELVARSGFETTAFDVAPGAIDLARRRHPESEVDYVVADLLALPQAWIGAFDLVVECITVQALPEPQRGEAIRAVTTLVAPGGTLLVNAAAREPDEPPPAPPWPLTRAEIDSFAVDGLRLESLEDLPGEVRRWRAVLRRD